MVCIYLKVGWDTNNPHSKKIIEVGTTVDTGEPRHLRLVPKKITITRLFIEALPRFVYLLKGYFLPFLMMPHSCRVKIYLLRRTRFTAALRAGQI